MLGNVRIGVKAVGHESTLQNKYFICYRAP
jgi:hypothetical protein